MRSTRAQFAPALEKVSVDTVGSGSVIRDLALLIGVEQKWLITKGSLDRVDENLKKAKALRRAYPVRCVRRMLAQQRRAHAAT